MHRLAICDVPFLFQHYFTKIETRNLGSNLIYIALSEINLDASKRTAAALCYNRPIVCSHVLNYFVDHLNLSEIRSQ
jgi:hypothetical protein